MADKAEAVCGFRPVAPDVLGFLRRLSGETDAPIRPAALRSDPKAPRLPATSLRQSPDAATAASASMTDQTRGINFRIFEKDYVAASASDALVRVLEIVCSRNPAKLPDFAREAEGRSRKHIGQSAGEIYPDRHDLKVAEFCPGWFVGLNIANREKMRLIRVACTVYSLTIPGDVAITLPNAA